MSKTDPGSSSQSLDIDGERDFLGFAFFLGHPRLFVSLFWRFPDS